MLYLLIIFPFQPDDVFIEHIHFTRGICIVWASGTRCDCLTNGRTAGGRRKKNRWIYQEIEHSEIDGSRTLLTRAVLRLV